MKLKNLSVAIAGVAFAAWLGACGTPTVHCLVQSSPSGTAYAFHMKYLSTTDTGPCANLKSESIGFQVYNKPHTNDFSLAWRTNGIGVPINNGVTSTEIDEAMAAGGCDTALGVCSGLDNPKANGGAKMPAFPTDDLCEMSDFTGAEQHFDAIPPTLDDDGGVIDPGAPATDIAYNFTKLRFVSNTNAPGTVFDGELTYTQDACTAHYKVFGFWPAIGCETDEDCNPVANPDAGRTLGSGINPTFAPEGKPVKCNTEQPFSDPIFGDFSGVCEIQFTSADEIKALK